MAPSEARDPCFVSAQAIGDDRTIRCLHSCARRSAAAPGITADELIADHGGDAHAAITILLELVDALQRENVSLAKAVSHGFMRSAWRRNPQ